jgi:hypothetical protein
MATTVTETTVEGLAALAIENAHLRMLVIPELGGKVISLVRRPSGYEFLWRHPGRSLRPAAYGADFAAYDISGWDECFPSIAEVVYPKEPWTGTVVPDHGELWTLPWHYQVEVDTLRMWTHSVRFAYHFQRTFHFTPSGGIDLAYEVSNPTPFPLHGFWSMHPFFNVTPASRLLLPQGIRVRVEISTDWRIAPFLGESPWPLAVDRRHNQPVDLSVMGAPDQGTIEKLYTTPLPEGWAALYHPDDEHFLAFTFDRDEIPFMGICQMRGGWPSTGEPSYSLILEPCNGWPDRLDLAIDRGAGLVVPGGGTLRWGLTLHLGQGRQALEQILDRRL